MKMSYVSYRGSKKWKRSPAAQDFFILFDFWPLIYHKHRDMKG